MAVEPKRGCGFRKIGGTYLEGDPGGFECGRLPVPIKPCAHCGHRPKFTRSLQRVHPLEVMHAAGECTSPEDCGRCPFSTAVSQDEVGLMWVGDGHYTPGSFSAEAAQLGVSKRISVVPKWLKVGESWIFLAHEKALDEKCPDCRGEPTIMEQTCERCSGRGEVELPAVFYAFVPRRLVRIIPDNMPTEEREELEAQGLTLKVVPADDPDHQAKGNGGNGGGGKD